MKNSASKPKKAATIKKPVPEREMAVTKRLLDLKIQEVKGDVTSLRLEMRAGFTQLDGKVESLRTHMDAKFEVIQTQMTKMMVILEEQNNRNRVALDGYLLCMRDLVKQKNVWKNWSNTLLAINNDKPVGEMDTPVQ